MATLDQYKNLALAQIAAAPSPPTTGTSLTLVAGQGAWLPTPPFNATVFNQTLFPTPANAEIVRVTAIAGAVATIVRQQEGSTARAIAVNDFLAATFTTKFVTDITDSSNQSSGSLPDARLSANIARRDQPNTYSNGVQVFATQANLGRIVVRDLSQAANGGAWQFSTSGGLLNVSAITDDYATAVAANLVLDRLGNVKVAADLTEKNRLTPIGHWTAYTPTLTANAGTVVLNTNYSCKSTLIGKTLHLSFYMDITLSGTPTVVTLSLPGGVTAVGGFASGGTFASSGGGAFIGMAQLNAGVLNLARDAAAGMAWPTGAQRIGGAITLEIT